jgi:hypothetical protein
LDAASPATGANSMTEQMPINAALIEAARRNKWSQPLIAPNQVHANVSLHADIIELARMIEKYEPDTLVDPVEKMLREEARDIAVSVMRGSHSPNIAPAIKAGQGDHYPVTQAAFDAIRRGYELGKASR